MSIASAAQAPNRPEEFILGIRALDFQEWGEAADLMKEAQQLLDEDGERTRIYGYRYQWYLPHYYRGLALFELERCGEALEEWNESESKEHIKRQGRQREYAKLKELKAECETSPPDPKPPPR